MAKKVIIHPGFPKSGTTALQASLMQAQKELANQGLHFAPPWNNAHHRAAWAITRYVFGWKSNGGESTPISAWENLCDEIKNVKSDALITSEFLIKADPTTIQQIKRDLGQVEIKIVFTLRPFAKLLPSRYQQSLKKGRTWTYDEWLKTIFKDSGSVGLTDYAEILQNWVEAFGKENVSLIIADETNPEFLYRSFEQALGLAVETLKPAKIKRLNRSLTASEVEILRQVNLRKPKKWKWKQYNLFVRGKFVRNLSDKPSAFKEDPKLVLPSWAIEKLQPYASSQISRIEKLGIDILGDPKSLHSDTFAIDTNTNGFVPAAMAADLVIQLAAIPSVKDARTRDLVKEVFKRIKSRFK